jgi:ubiquinone/menaquinone biosynthesis C-methylase UbiE
MLLKREYPSVQVVGLDPDPKALRRAKNKLRRAGVSAQLDQGFADQLSYKDDSFDRVFSSFMFHHLEEHDREKMLSEVLRVLKPEGSFHLLDFAADHASHGPLDHLIHAHARLKDNTQERMLQLMISAGFRNAEKVKEGKMLLGLLRTAYYRASNG